MRRIICNFEDGAEFLNHLERPTFNSHHPPKLKFLASFALSIGEVVRITLVIDATGERHDLHLRVCERRPTMAYVNRDTRWSYCATATDGDAPWLVMLAQKFDTAQRLSA